MHEESLGSVIRDIAGTFIPNGFSVAAPQQLLRTPARPLLSDVHPDVRREAVGVLGWLQATGTLAEVARLFPNASRASQAGHEGLRR